MQASPRLLVAAVLATFATFPAAAESVVLEQGHAFEQGRSGVRHSGGRHVDARHRAPRIHRNSAFVGRRHTALGVLPFGVYDALPPGGYDVPPAGGAPSSTVVVAPPPPPRSEADERPTVEITASGVQIVRGPGTHHTRR